MPGLGVLLGTGATSPVECVRAMDSLDRVVYVTSSRDEARMIKPLLRPADEIKMIEPSDLSICDRAAQWQLDGIVTFSETHVVLAAEIAARLGLRGNSPEVVIGLTDKAEQRRRLRLCDVDAVRSSVVATVDDWLAIVALVSFPVVIKPRRGVGSRHTVLARDADEALRLVTDALSAHSRCETELVVEEYLEGVGPTPYTDYVSVESFWIDGRPQLVGVTGKFPQLSPFRETGQFYPAGLSPETESEVVDIAHRAEQALGMRFGVCHTEIKLTPTGPRIIEVNSRLGGFLGPLYHAATGQNLVRSAAHIAVGMDCPVPGPTADGIHFQYYNQPPLRACRLVRVEGARGVADLPGITAYTQFVLPGDRLPRDGGSCNLDFIAGRGDDHRAVAEALAGVLERLTITFEDAVGELFTSSNRDHLQGFFR